MNYRVDWSPTAHDRLEELWVAAENQSAVLRAANAVDNYLAEDPYRHDAHRIASAKRTHSSSSHWPLTTRFLSRRVES